MHTVIHCSVYASASTGGPSSGCSRAQPNPSTNVLRPKSQSPEKSHAASPATITSFFIGSPAPRGVYSWPIRSCSSGSTRSFEHGPPAPLELAGCAVVAGCGRHGQTVSAGRGSLACVREKVAEAVQQPVQIGRGAHVARAPVRDELGQAASRKRHHGQTHAAGFERNVAEGFFLKNRRSQYVARFHDVENV